ncbi:hypothetical protein GCM10010510_44660 [Streptomyces anandii JCM 4720]|nr:hypothetical protein GCM10010510_44660 [Streptomyces anandii JCM 4720]
MAMPDSEPRPTLSWPIASLTSPPRPPVPTMPAIAAMDRPSMITWLTPAMTVGSASGSWTRSSVLRGVVPNASAASTSSLSTWRMPSSVMRTPGARAKIRVATMPAEAPVPKNRIAGMR